MITKSRTIIFLILLLPALLFAQKLPPKSKLCPKNDCRGPLIIKLTKKDGTLFKQNHPYLYPVVQKGMGLTIFPGERFSITGNFKKGQLVDIKLLKKGSKIKPLLTFTFEQKEGKMMFLTAKNHTKHLIKYHATMMPLSKEQLYKTSSCPIDPGLVVFESWPYPIYQLFIPKIFILKKGESRKCVY